MELLQYTEKHNEFRQKLRSFIENDVTPYADQWEKDHLVPKSVWKKMGKEGFLCTAIAPEYGGLGGDFLYSVIVMEELSRSNQTGLIAPLHSDIVVPYINSYGSEEIKKAFLPGCVSGDLVSAVAMTEPGAGSDLASMTTTAVEDGDHIIINGTKTFISNGINSDVIIVAARDPNIQDTYQAISLYVVESSAQGFERGRQLDKMGLRSQDTAELFFSKCRIPKSNMLGTKGMGFIMLMEKLQQERLVTAIMAIAACENVMEWVINYCKTNTRAGKPLSKYQDIQFALVEMVAEIKMVRTFVNSLIVDHMNNQNVVIETSIAKYKTTDLVKHIIDRSMDIIGEFSALESCILARAFRDVRIMSIFAGTNEIMKQIAAKFMGL